MYRILRVFSFLLPLILIGVQALGDNSNLYLPHPLLTKEGRLHPINDVYVIHLIVDGANYETMQRAIRTGKLPTLKETFIDKGAQFTSAISTFPSTSTSAYQSFITGLLPGHAGIPHLQRFDRQREEFIDYLSAKGYLKLNDDFINLKALQNPVTANLDATNTIFELLHGYPTLALYTTARRGAAESVPKRIPVRGLWAAGVSYDFLRIDQLAFNKLFKRYGGKLQNVPRYSLVGLYSVDVAGHYHGADSDAVRTALEQFDYFLRDFLALLERQGIHDKTYIIVSADHGMHNTGNVFRFRDALIEKNIAVKPRNPQKKNYNVVPADRGISSTHIYTRRQDGSFAPLDNVLELASLSMPDGTSVDLIELIRDMEPTQLIAARDGDNRVMVMSANGGVSTIICSRLNAEDWCSYDVMTAPDPLEIKTPRAKRLMDGKPHSSQEWKHATADEYYTDAIIQLGTLFKDGRGGDLFVIPKNAWGFRVLKAATHGSLIRDDMHIPMFIAGPGVPHGSYGAMRTVDLYPLMLEWFGFDVPTANYDGVNPFEKYRGENKLWQRLAAIEQNCSAKNCVRRHTKHRRAALKPLAKIELKDRTLLLARLRNYIAALEAQKADKRAPQVALPDYVDDHLAIAKRVEKLTERRKEKMQRIIDAL